MVSKEIVQQTIAFLEDLADMDREHAAQVQSLVNF